MTAPPEADLQHKHYQKKKGGAGGNLESKTIQLQNKPQV